MHGTAQQKGERYERVKARRKRQEAARRKACLIQVYAREGMRCQRCGRHVVEPFTNDQPLSWAQVHEKVPRSLGGSPYDPDNCELLCMPHHNEAQKEPKR